MGERALVRLADACESIDYGFTASASDHPVGPKFLRITDIINGPIDWASVPYCDADEHQAAQFALGEGDVVVARTGATVGTVGFVREPRGSVFASYLVRLRAGTGLESRYLFYCLKTPAWRHHIDGVASGKSAQPNASASAMAEFEIPLPSMGEQRAIAEVLGALDDKIESNRRLAVVAEELIRTELSFATDEGWPELPVSSLAEFVNGGALTKDATGTGRMVVRIAELKNGPGGSTIYNELDVPEEKLARPGDVLMSWSGSLGVFRWARPEAIINQHIFKVICGEYPPWLVYIKLAEVMPEFQQIAAEVEALTVESLRDALLPELLSGRLRVPIGDAMASA